MTEEGEDTTIILKQFIHDFSYGNALPLIEQIKDSISKKDPSLLYQFYLDFNALPTEIKTILFEEQDFAVFSKKFGDAVKLIISETDINFWEQIQEVDIKVRFRNFMFEPEKNEYSIMHKIHEVNSSFTDKYTVTKGVVSTVLKPQASMKKIKYQCQECNHVLIIDLNKGSTDMSILDQLKKCSNPNGCEGKNSYKMKHMKSNSVDTQIIFLEELVNDSDDKDSAVIKLQLDGDLVNKYDIGETVVVSGNVRYNVYDESVINQVKRKFSDSKFYNMLSIYGGGLNSIDFDYIIECNYIEKLEDNNVMFTNISDEIKQQIIALSTDHRLMPKLITSYCPEVYGYDIVKEMLIYTHVGGLGRSIDPEIDTRGELNNLLFGDPSTAKSELLKYALRMSNKSRFADGGGMTDVGLRGAVVGAGEDTGSVGNWRLTAGLAAKTDMGMLGIDELQDTAEDVIGALKEIMENQTATIAKVKSGSFKARISVIAACNPPKHGNYDITKNFNENLGMNAALLSRFDGIFLFLDIPNPEIDPKIAETMLKRYNKQIKPDLTRDFLAKYLYYAKNSGIIPTMSDEVSRYIQGIYNRMRTLDLNYNAEHIGENRRRTVATRQLQTVIRIATARARTHLRTEVTIDDVNRAEYIVMSIIKTVAIDVNTGKVDIGILAGDSANEMNKEGQFFKLLERMAAAFDNKVDSEQFMDELMKQPGWKDLTLPRIKNEIKKYVNQNNIILMNGNISLTHYNGSKKNQ